MKQIARNATMDDCGALRDCCYLLYDRDTKYTRSFRVSLRKKPFSHEIGVPMKATVDDVR